MDTRPIVVGVDGSDGSAAAIRYGADKAYASGRGLHLVHVAPVFIPLSGAAPMGTAYLPQDFDAIDKKVLSEAVAYARALMPSDRLTSALTVGARSSGLLHESRHASEIVLGEDRTPFLERISFGSMVAQVCAHSPVPVTCVPESWRPDRSELVVVGIHDYHHISLELLRAGFIVAQERAASIEFIHVWDLPPSYGRIVDSVMDFPRWRAMVERVVTDAVTEAVGHDPGAFTVRAVHGHPSHELHARSQEASLILLGHHRSGGFFDHLGGTGRTLLRTSDCPVEVMPVSDPVVPADIGEHHESLTA